MSTGAAGHQRRHAHEPDALAVALGEQGRREIEPHKGARVPRHQRLRGVARIGGRVLQHEGGHGPLGGHERRRKAAERVAVDDDAPGIGLEAAAQLVVGLQGVGLERRDGRAAFTFSITPVVDHEEAHTMARDRLDKAARPGEGKGVASEQEHRRAGLRLRDEPGADAGAVGGGEAQLLDAPRNSGLLPLGNEEQRLVDRHAGAGGEEGEGGGAGCGLHAAG